jgi:hemoglobin-like flavoprotein
MVYHFGLRLAERFKLGGPSLGRSPDAHKQRRLVNKIKSNFSRKTRVDTIFERGWCPALFFAERFVIASRFAGTLPALRTSSPSDMPASPNPIERSFEIAALRCEDLTPLVYRRLFEAHPEARTMFRTEGSESVMGSMLALTIDAILDFAGERTGHFRMNECEVSSHDAYGTPRDLFVAFFGIIAETLREILGTDWTPDTDAAWRRLLGEIDDLVAAQKQPSN